jgi:hypothetical protein
VITLPYINIRHDNLSDQRRDFLIPSASGLYRLFLASGDGSDLVAADDGVTNAADEPGWSDSDCTLTIGNLCNNGLHYGFI